jgi:glycosyltransferase involved in cell wall biosynthesis
VTEITVAHGTHDFINGGAGRAAKRIVDATRAVGIDSLMISSPDSRTWRRALEQRLSRWQGSAPGNFKSAAFFPGRSFSKFRTDSPRVIHLHWVGNAFLSIRQIGKIETPIVWTLHDMWPFAGNEHYASLEQNALWRKGSGNGPTNSHPDIWNQWVWRRKRRHWNREITFIATSKWLSELKSHSELMPDASVIMIPNPVPLDIFRPTPQNEARKLLGIPPSIPLIGFIADEGDANPLKGFSELSQALVEVRRHIPDVHLLHVGKVNSKPTLPSIPTFNTGQLRDDNRLALAYAACDVICVPSILDNAPQTVAEASASGKPVVGFDSGGVPEMISHNVTGLIAPLGDVNFLSGNIISILNSADFALRMGQAGRQRACALWSPEVVGNQYRNVYQQVTGLGIP